MTEYTKFLEAEIDRLERSRKRLLEAGKKALVWAVRQEHADDADGMDEWFGAIEEAVAWEEKGTHAQR